MPRFTRTKRHTGRARQLRRNPTEAERRVWNRIRHEQLGIPFRRQHPVVGYVVDFYAPSIRLAVEIDGGQHAVITAADEARTNLLLSRGMAVLRFWNSDVMDNLDGVCEAVGLVARWLASQTPPPTPPLAGEGGARPDLGTLNLRLSLPETTA